MHLRSPKLIALFSIFTFLMTLLPQTSLAQIHPLIVFNDANYSGYQCHSIAPESNNIFAGCDEQISSIQLRDGWSVRLYRDLSQAGSTVCLSRNDNNLADNTFEDSSALDNAISSFTLYDQLHCSGSPVPTYPLEVYNDVGYATSTPNSWCYSPYAETANIYSWCRDQVSSILLRSGWSIQVYDAINQGGLDACITASDPDLQDNTFADGSSLNDTIASFSLFADPSCGASDSIFGDGTDDDFAGGDPNTIRTALQSSASAAQPTLAVASSAGFVAGDEVLVIAMQGSSAGTYEFATVASVDTGMLRLDSNLQHAYTQDSIARSQVVRVPHFTTVSGGITTSEWNGSTGGVIVFRAQTIAGATVDVSARGFKGGIGKDSIDTTCLNRQAQQGHAPSGAGGCSRNNNGGGGGGGDVGTTPPHFGAGGGGGYASPGGVGAGPYSGTGGAAYGSADLAQVFLGAGGGGGSWGTNPYGGGRNSIQGNDASGQGAGIALIFGQTMTGISVLADGAAGGNSTGSSGGYGGGGGAGGSIKLIGDTIALDTVRANGGAGGTGALGNGGNGSTGRIRIEACGSAPAVTTSPPASVAANACGATPGISTLSSISIGSAVANAGDLPLIIKGTNLRAPLTARLGGIDLLAIDIETPTTVHAVVPVGRLPQGTHDLTVVSNGTTLTLANAFTVTGPAPVTQFRVMIYLACDAPDIEASCEELFNQLELAMTDQPDLRIVAFWDGYSSGDSAYYLIQPDRNPYQRAKYIKDQSYVPIGEADTAAPNTLVTFAAWAHSKYPGVYRMLSLVGHGGGWAPTVYPGQPQWFGRKPATEVGGILWDFGSNNTMATAPLAQALRWIVDAYPIDIVYLDACLMATAEVVTELGPVTQFLVAYENLSWAYHPYADYLRKVSSSTTPRDLAIHIAKVSQSLPSAEHHPAQVGVIDMQRLAGLETTVSQLGSSLIAALPFYRPAIAEAAIKTARVNNKDIKQMVINLDDQALDLYDFSSNLAAHPGLPASIKDSAQRVQHALSQVMIENYIQSGTPWEGRQFWDLSRLQGLSIYFPLVDDWRRGFYKTAALPRFAQGAWDDFIHTWHQHQTPPPPPTEPCENCPYTPSHIALSVDGPPTADRGKLIYVKLILHNITATDNLHGLQVKLISDNTDVLVPASDRAPRYRSFFPSNSYRQAEPLINGWQIITNIPGTTDAPQGSGTVVEFPFYTPDDGCANLRILDSTLVNGHIPAQPLTYQHSGQTICVGQAPPSSVVGTVYLEGRSIGRFGGVTVTLRGAGTTTYTTMTQPDGTYIFPHVVPGAYVIAVTHPLYLATERTISVHANTAVTIPAVGLWGGDFDQNNKIQQHDWRICAAAAWVNDPSFDLDANGRTDVGDCAIVAKNSGRSSSQPGDPPPPNSAQNMDLQRAELRPTNMLAFAHAAQHIHLIPQGEDSLMVRVTGSPAPFYALGLRLSLPEGAAVVQAEGQGVFAGQFIATDRSAQTLYLIAALDDATAGTQTSDIALLQFYLPPGTSLQNMHIEAAGLVAEAKLATRIFLPLAQR